MNVTPPSMPDDAFFTNIYWNAQLSVPTGALAAYQEAIGLLFIKERDEQYRTEEVPFSYF